MLNEVSEKITSETLIAPSTEAYLKEWLEGVSTRATPSTAERYRNSVKLFLASLGSKAQKPVTAVTPKDAELFVNSRLKAGVAPKTAIVDLKTINIAFRRAENYGIILKNPVVAFRILRKRSETFGTIRKASARFRKVRKPSERFRILRNARKTTR